MSEAEESLIETNPEEDISKEVSETDYTEETGQENDFDVADLECVDEEEAERSEDRGRIKEASPKRSLRGNRFSDHRHEPYKRPHRSSESLKKNKNSPSKLNRDQQRKRNYLERKKNEKAANSVTDIDFDELEEIDSYEYEDQDNNFATPSTTSGTTESASATPVLDYTDNDEHDDWGRLQENGTDLQSDEEDFPTLSEDIDADVLEQITQENIALLVNSTQPNKLNDSERQNVDLLTPPETSKTNGDIKEISNHGASTKKLDDEGLEQESRQSRIDKEARLKKWKSPEEKLKELKKRKRKIDDQQERQTESASPSSHKSGQRCISEERTTRDDSPSKGYHDRQVGGRRRGRDDDILPPSRKQIRNLLDQLVERNNRIRREEKSEERRKTSHHEENGESTKSGTKSHAHSESRPSPQS